MSAIEQKGCSKSLVQNAGVSPKVVQARLGHSDITTTMNVYSHVTETLQGAAVEALSSYLKGA
jgi:integrase